MKTNEPWSDSLRNHLLIAHMVGTVTGTMMPEDIRIDWTSAVEAADAFGVLSAGDLVFLVHEVSRMQAQYADRLDAVAFVDTLHAFIKTLDSEVWP